MKVNSLNVINAQRNHMKTTTTYDIETCFPYDHVICEN